MLFPTLALESNLVANRLDRRSFLQMFPPKRISGADPGTTSVEMIVETKTVYYVRMFVCVAQELFVVKATNVAINVNY